MSNKLMWHNALDFCSLLRASNIFFTNLSYYVLVLKRLVTRLISIRTNDLFILCACFKLSHLIIYFLNNKRTIIIWNANSYRECTMECLRYDPMTVDVITKATTMIFRKIMVSVACNKVLSLRLIYCDES